MDKFSSEIRSKTMRAVRSEKTSLEIMVTKALWKRGVRFRKNTKDLIGKPDIAIKKYKVVVFLDSCFWHGCYEHCRMPETNQNYWIKKIDRNRERDKEITNYYIESNWKVLRVWEHDLKNNFEETLETIIHFIVKNKKS